MKPILTILLLCAVSLHAPAQTPPPTYEPTIDYGNNGFTLTPYAGKPLAKVDTKGFGIFGTNRTIFNVAPATNPIVIFTTNNGTVTKQVFPVTNNIGDYLVWLLTPSGNIIHQVFSQPPAVLTITASGSQTLVLTNPPAHRFWRIGLLNSDDLKNWRIETNGFGSWQLNITK